MYSNKFPKISFFIIYFEISLLILPRMYSMVPSNTRFNSGSKPFKTPLAENRKQ